MLLSEECANSLAGKFFAVSDFIQANCYLSLRKDKKNHYFKQQINQKQIESFTETLAVVFIEKQKNLNINVLVTRCKY